MTVRPERGVAGVQQRHIGGDLNGRGLAAGRQRKVDVRLFRDGQRDAGALQRFEARARDGHLVGPTGRKSAR